VKRKLTLIETTAIGLGNIIGAGIFVIVLNWPLNILIQKEEFILLQS